MVVVLWDMKGKMNFFFKILIRGKILMKYSFFFPNRTEHGWEDWHVDWLYYLKWAVFGYFWLPLFFNIFYQYSIHPRGGPRDERYFDPNL